MCCSCLRRRLVVAPCLCEGFRFEGEDRSLNPDRGPLAGQRRFRGGTKEQLYAGKARVCLVPELAGAVDRGLDVGEEFGRVRVADPQTAPLKPFTSRLAAWTASRSRRSACRVVATNSSAASILRSRTFSPRSYEMWSTVVRSAAAEPTTRAAMTVSHSTLRRR